MTDERFGSGAAFGHVIRIMGVRMRCLRLSSLAWPALVGCLVLSSALFAEWEVARDDGKARPEASPVSRSPDVIAALERAGENRAELERALREVSYARRDGMEFLIANMPAPDLESLTADFLLENVNLAYEVMDEVPWGRSIPRELFLNDVLPYASVTERRDPWRKEFRERFLPVVKDCRTAGEAAQLLNQKICAELNVRYSTGRRRADQSPKESSEIGLASCTGLSIILVD